MKIEHFEDIDAWQLARELTCQVYRLTKKQGFEKDYGLKRQIQEAAGSAMHNIAEGFDSETNAEYEPARRTRAAIRGFINYLTKCKTSKAQPTAEPLNREPLNPTT